MKFASQDIEDLKRLAIRLKRAAETSQAKAAEHTEHGETKDAEREQDRANSARHYVTVLDRVARQCGEIDAPTRFIAPTLEEVKAYIWAYSHEQRLPKMPASEVEGWYDHFCANGWKVSGKTIMKDWKAGVRNGYRMWRQKQPTGGTSAVAQVKQKGQDPDGWRQFLTRKGKEYRPYRVSLEHIREEFDKEAKA